uniref:thiol oxidase n=1 Tax=viral metagenome TaxID=1070528 RepID=A0A6C0HP49_9ZZZZ
MSKKIWGNAVWYLFHTLVYKIKSTDDSNFKELFGHISSISKNLPCPECSEHAALFLSRVNIDIVTSSRENMITFLFEFHNSVNKKIGKPIYLLEDLKKYSLANTINIINHFIAVMNSNSNNSRLMMDSFNRQKAVKVFMEYISQNIHKYKL